MCSSLLITTKYTIQHEKTISYFGGACRIMGITVGNGHGDSNSNPRQGGLHFTKC